MSVASALTIDEKREEAVKLFLTAVQLPISVLSQGDDIANQIIKGADTLLQYIQSGKPD